MPTTDEQNLSDSDIDIDDGNKTKCFCPICGTDISLVEALQCDECGCMFCSLDCARKYPHCDAELHR
jgi:hypothetical protein